VSAIIWIAPRALNDIESGSAFYFVEGGESLSARFEAGVLGRLDQLRDAPRSGARYRSELPELVGIRWVRVTGFEVYLIFYRVDGERIEVVRVLHGARFLDGLLDDSASDPSG